MPRHQEEIRGFAAFVQASCEKINGCFRDLTTDRHQFLDVSTNFVFGASNASLASFTDITKTEEFLGAFEEALQGGGIRMFFGKFRYLVGGDGAANEACARVHEVVDEFFKYYNLGPRA